MAFFKHFFRDKRKASIVSLACPKCSLSTVIKDEYLLGSVILCPFCHTEISVPPAAPPPEGDIKNPECRS